MIRANAGRTPLLNKPSIGSVGLSGAEKLRPCQARPLSGLSVDRFCFLILTVAPDLPQGVRFPYDAAFSAAAFVAKARNLRVGKQGPVYAKVINQSFLYILKHEFI